VCVCVCELLAHGRCMNCSHLPTPLMTVQRHHSTEIHVLSDLSCYIHVNLVVVVVVQQSEVRSLLYRSPCVGPGHPRFPPCPLTFSSFALFLLFPFLIGFNCFLLSSISSVSTRIDGHAVSSQWCYINCFIFNNNNSK